MTDTVIMTKGETVDLSKKSPGLKKVYAGAAWDMKEEGSTMDLDLSAFLLCNGKLRNGSKDNVVYFNHKVSGCGSVASRGDNLTGGDEGVGDDEGDDEVIDVNLEKVPSYIDEILFVATIYQGRAKGESLLDLNNAYVRIVNAENNQELCKFTIKDTDDTHESFVLGKLVRNADGWGFVAIGETATFELEGFMTRYGLQAAA